MPVRAQDLIRGAQVAIGQVLRLDVAQTEKDQALAQFVQALRGYWEAYYRLRRLTLFDFETGQPIRR